MINTKILTFTRFIAAFWVVLFHFFANTKLVNFNFPLIEIILNNGNLAVIYFFILSGFILTHVELLNFQSNWSFFLKKRFFRLYPIYFVALLMSSLLLNSPPTLLSLITNILCLQVFIPNWNTINSPSWSIGQEFIFYLLFPLLFKYSKSKIISYTLLITLSVFGLIDFIFFHTYFQNSLPQYFWIISSFIFGIYLRKMLNIQWVFNALNKYHAPLFLIAITSFFLFISFFQFNFFYGNIFINISFGILILSLTMVKKETIVNKLFSSKLAIFLGEISYAIYIFQVPIYFISKYFYTHRPRLQFAIFIALLLFLSSMATKFIERPFIAYSKK